MGQLTARDAGFSLVEIVVTMALVAVAAAVMVALADSGRTALSTQPDSADMHQRMRVAADALYKDLVVAGAGAYAGPESGPLTNVFAPILPYRTGPNNPDPPGTFSVNAISVLYVPTTAAQTTLSVGGPGGNTGNVSVDVPVGCPVSTNVCGFLAGIAVLVFERSGLHDTFSVAGVTGDSLALQSNSPTLMYAAYPAHAVIVESVAAVYSLKPDPATGAFQLVRSNGGAGSDVPVVDHIVSLTFDYYGEPEPPRRTAVPLDDAAGPWTTYGAPPPLPDVQGPTAGYPPGESCLFVLDPVTREASPRLQALGPGGSNGLVKLTASELTDGPWCPDGGNPNRWDADLLRIRSIGVTLRVQSANAALRGPAGVLFANAGTARGVSRWLPDIETSFRVTPRNLNLGR